MIEQHSQSTCAQFEAALSLAGIDISGSELHGLIHGAICNQVGSGRECDVCALAFAGADASAVSDTLRDQVARLFADAARPLTTGSGEIELLLPADDDDVVRKTAALADWCRGFVLGLLHNKVLTIEQLPADAAEITRDLLAIAEAETSGNDPTADGWALAEIEEYVRVGVQVIYEELAKGPSRDRIR